MANGGWNGAAVAAAAMAGVALAAALGAPWYAAACALAGGGVAMLLLLRPSEPPLPVAPEIVTGPDPGPTTPLAYALDAIDDPVLIVDRGRVTLANAAARTTLGEHILGEDVRLAIRHPSAAARLAGDEADSGPVELGGLGASERRWEMAAHRLPDGARLVRLVDRTLARATERMRVDFVANASHELRTPLAAILGFIETLEDAGDDAAVRNRFLAIMDGEARRMQRLIDDLMSLSRIEADRHRAPADAVALRPVVDEVVAAIAATDPAAAGRIAVIVDPPRAPAVAGDRAQLLQLLHNLIGNALKYGRAGGRVEVRLDRSRDDMLRLAVIDEGDGIAPQHLPRLTERFYRIDTSRSRSVGGTGLGLAIVKHIVERHRGRLDIESAPGRGTTVAVLLPLHRPVTGLSQLSHTDRIDPP